MTTGFDGGLKVWDSKQESKQKDQISEVPFIPYETKTVTNTDGEELGLINICFDTDLTSGIIWATTVKC